MKFSALDRQKEIYLDGFSGRRPRIPTSFDQLEAAAREKASEAAFAYIAGGAGMQTTVANNREGFHKLRIRPRMLRDVSTRDTSIELFGRRLPSPLFLAPIGALELVHKEADKAVARAAARLGLPMIFSNQAAFSMEDCSAEMGDSPRWFQLYWSKSDELVISFLQRAAACGCEAIVVTLDTTMLGWRPMDLDLGHLPFSFAKGLGQYVSDPVFQRIVRENWEKGGLETPPGFTFSKLFNFFRQVANYKGGGSFLQKLQSKFPLVGVRTFTDIYSRPSISWDDLSFLREHTKLPILLKGILRGDDAQLALDHGVDGIIVSNHGGRQVGGAIASIDALPEVVKVIDGRIPVLMDSGIRDGSDVFKALALGATAACIGRPYAYALALAGEQGVYELLANMMAEFELTMGLAGCRGIGEMRGLADERM